MLQINLFHEIQRAEFERKYDPVRIAVVVFIVGLLGFGLWTALLYLRYRPLRESVESLQKQMKTIEPQTKQAEVQLAELPAYQSEFALLKKRAEGKSLISKDMEVFKSCMLPNLYVKKLAITREVVLEKVAGPKNKKGQPTVITKTVSFNQLNFEVTYSEPTKPKSLEQRDQLIELFTHSEQLRQIAMETTDDGKVVNKLKVVNFSTTEPMTNEPAIGTLNLNVELKK